MPASWHRVCSSTLLTAQRNHKEKAVNLAPLSFNSNPMISSPMLFNSNPMIFNSNPMVSNGMLFNSNPMVDNSNPMIASSEQPLRADRFGSAFEALARFGTRKTTQN